MSAFIVEEGGTEMATETQYADALARGDYDAVVRIAETEGFRRSDEAIARELEHGSIGQYGLTLDEACAYMDNLEN